MNTAVKSSNIKTGNILYLEPLKLLDYRVFTGCNVYHSSTVILQSFSCGGLLNATIGEQAGENFARAFLSRFTGLKSFVQNNGLNQKFIDALKSGRGVSFPEALLEAILAVETSIAFARHELDTVSFAAIEKHENRVDIIWSSTIPKLSCIAAEVALKGMVELLPEKFQASGKNSSSSFNQDFDKLWQQARRRRLAPSTSVIKQAATKRGIPYVMLGRQHLQLGQGRLQQQIYASMTGATSITAQKICVDKRLTNRRLTELRLPIPKQLKVGSVKAALSAAKKIGFPIVIKPVKGKKGIGVTAGLESEEGIQQAFDKAHQKGSDVLIEKFITGEDFRLLVIGGKFVAAVNRQPPIITGDGKLTVDELIEQLNAQPYRDGFRGFPVDKDAELFRLLEQVGLTLTDIPEEGVSVALRSMSNVSSGGIPIDVTDQVHPDVREMAERATHGVGLDVAGIDFMTTDIAQSYRKTGGAIIEINARPGLDIHTWPMIGKPRNVAGELLKQFFPQGVDGKIPVVAVTGDNGTGSTARTLDKILRQAGRSNALVLQSESFVNGSSAELTAQQQLTAPLILLNAPDVDMLVSTVSLRQTARRGMLLENSTITVVMDRVKEGAVNQFYKGLDVAQRATSDCFIVGAGNRAALDRIKLNDRRLILVGERMNDPALQSHINAGHDAVSTIWHEQETRIALISGKEVVATIPFQFSSTSDSVSKKRRLKNAIMFAVAAAFGLGLSGSEIESAISEASSVVIE